MTPGDYLGTHLCGSFHSIKIRFHLAIKIYSQHTAGVFLFLGDKWQNIFFHCNWYYWLLTTPTNVVTRIRLIFPSLWSLVTVLCILSFRHRNEARHKYAHHHHHRSSSQKENRIKMNLSKKVIRERWLMRRPLMDGRQECWQKIIIAKSSCEKNCWRWIKRKWKFQEMIFIIFKTSKNHFKNLILSLKFC